MGDETIHFDRDTARAEWDHGADAWAEFQATGRDYCRLEFFGPAQIAMCGDVAGLRVLDLGCGNGYFSRAMAGRGARVTAVDLSPKQIGHARRIEAEQPMGIDYRVMDAETVGEHFAPDSFDLVTSCVALQDMPEPKRAIAGAFAVLRPGGRLVAAITHPCVDTPLRQWATDETGTRTALMIDRYFERVPMTYTWSERRMAYTWQITSRHATLSDWFGWFLEAGLALRALSEPQPTPETLARHPDIEDAARVPYFLLLDWMKPN
ncbi:MAG TPA: class I SAM-dependent methyltransferase [Paracoccaceae bacterium]|nr:class I SAM-dependent methyltransferase [Paracoccaceae bacterium]